MIITFWVTRSGAPEDSTPLMRFQLAPIKKLEGSLQTHFLPSSLRPGMTLPGGAGGGGGSGPLRRTRAGGIRRPPPRAAGQGAASAQLVWGWGGRDDGCGAIRGRDGPRASGRGGPRRPDTPPGPSATGERMGAARTLSVRRCAPSDLALLGPASVSLALDREYHLSAHTPFAGRQPGL